MKRFSPFVLTLLIVATLLSGLVHGILSQRWRPSFDVAQVKRLTASVPRQFGEWRMESQTPLDASTLEMLRCFGHLNRVYIHEPTGERVSVTLMYGPTGGLTAHTPEVCYGGAYDSLAHDDAVPITDNSGVNYSFSSVLFRAQDLSQNTLRVYYGWHDGKSWRGSGHPRWDFAQNVNLWKLQIASFEKTDATENGEDVKRFAIQMTRNEATGPMFLKSFLPAVAKLLDDSPVIVKNANSFWAMIHKRDELPR